MSAETELAGCRKALARIAEGRGAYSHDQLRHAENVIADAIATATAALEGKYPDEETETVEADQ